jgi:hypothetical protein
MAALYLILSHPKRGFLINDVREYVSVEIGSFSFCYSSIHYYPGTFSL